MINEDCSFCDHISFTSKIDKYGKRFYFCVDCINELKEIK